MMLRSKSRAHPVEVTGCVVVDSRRGLSTEPARRLVSRAAEFDCESTIETSSGKVASARALLELLLLGIAPGERVIVRCRGPQAAAAFQAIEALLARATASGNEEGVA